jgi:hypothetical protein
MRKKHAHLSDEEILLFIDRELPSRRRFSVSEHLAECQSCGSRRAELEGTLADFSNIYEDTISSQHAVSVHSRSMLKDRIAESASRSNQGWPSRVFLNVVSRQLVCAGIALLIVAAGGWTIHQVGLNRMKHHTIEFQALVLPRRTLTPGASRPVRFADLCSQQDLDNDPPVDPSLQQAVFREYGLANSSQAAYELDYLISPALGGSHDIKNLWPQPYSSVWNARVKDQLEDHLHKLVCERKVQLATAQDQIATDWIAAYKSYFDTDRPRSEPAALATDDAKQEVRLNRPRRRGFERLPIWPVAGYTERAAPVTTAALRLDE